MADAGAGGAAVLRSGERGRVAVSGRRCDLGGRVGLLVGKPLGIALATAVAVAMGLQAARGLDVRAVVVVGMLAGIGFTVALFFATAAFPEGSRVLDNAKMGALASFVAAPAAFQLARLLGVRARAAA